MAAMGVLNTLSFKEMLPRKQWSRAMNVSIHFSAFGWMARGLCRAILKSEYLRCSPGSSSCLDDGLAVLIAEWHLPSEELDS